MTGQVTEGEYNNDKNTVASFCILISANRRYPFLNPLKKKNEQIQIYDFLIGSNKSSL